MSAERVEIIPIEQLEQSIGRSLVEVTPLSQFRRGDRLAIKPNLTAPKPFPGVTTTMETLEALLRCSSDMGARVAIVESDGGYNSFSLEAAFDGHGLRALARRYGAELVNLSNEESQPLEVTARGKRIAIPWPKRLLHDTDFFCSVPVPKIHCMTGISLSLKNQWGCVPDTLRLRFHPYFQEAIWQLNAALPRAFAVLDARYGLTRQGPMEGTAVNVGCVAVASSLGACDVAGSRLMCIDPRRIKHLAYAHRSGFLPRSEDVEIVGPLEQYAIPGRFFLKRNVWNYVALTAWWSPAWNHAVYLGKASAFLHKVMYTFRKRPESLS